MNYVVDPSYEPSFRALSKMQETQRFLYHWGTAPPSLGFLFLIVAALKLDEWGYPNAGNFMIYAAVGMCFLYIGHAILNTFRLRAWRCPRCNHRWPGWVMKEASCGHCNLELPGGYLERAGGTNN
jgi:hypothetical protein